MPAPAAEAPEGSTANDALRPTTALIVDALADPVAGQQGEEGGAFGAAAPDPEEPLGAIRCMESRSDQSSNLGLAPITAEISNPEADSVSSVDATVIAWRPVRRPRTEGKARHFHGAKRGLPEANASTTRRESGSTPRGDPDREQERLRRRSPRASTSMPREAGPPPLRTRGGSESTQVEEKGRQALGKRNAAVGGANLDSQRRATVDQNSPFAKLLELRSILETQGKNRS